MQTKKIIVPLAALLAFAIFSGMNQAQKPDSTKLDKEKTVQITKGGAGTLEGLAPKGIRQKKDHEIKWMEWSDAAFEKAKQEDKLLLLDITAVWCHWCHVMDETSYSDSDLIRFLNERFIPVRVEADQRPDVQNRYLSGGWPTTAVLVPTGEVLWSGTYVSPEQLRQVLAQVEDYYRKNKPTVQAKIDSFKTQVAKSIANPAPLLGSLKFEPVEEVVASAIENLDAANGGFGDGQKFPAPGTMNLLLLENHLKKNPKIENVLHLTLKNQEKLLDPVWGGFYRYATKPDWSHPHYEKMLSANAELLENYLSAYQATGEEDYKKTALEVIRWLEGFMQNPKGGFYGSQDADLGSHEPEADFIAGEEYFLLEDAARKKLGIPHVDKNIFSDWNGQMIRAYLTAYPVLGEKKLLDFALLSLDKIKKTAWDPKAGMAHNPAAKTIVRGLIADQMEVTRASSMAYQVTGKKEHLDFAKEIMAWVLKNMQDAKGGGFYSSPQANLSYGNLSFPDKPFDENSTTALALIELYRLTGDSTYKKAAEHTLKLLSKFYPNRGYMAGTFAMALRLYGLYPNQIVIVGNSKDKTAQALHSAALRYYDPNKVVIFLDKGAKPLKVGEIEFPEMEKPALFACRQSLCSPPITDAVKVDEKLKKFFAQTN